MTLCRFRIILYSLFFFYLFFKYAEALQKEDKMITNSLLEKSLKFAARKVKLNKYLTKEKKEYVISKQIIRSATSIGANANEAIYGVSKAEFINKLHIPIKETAETEYWLRLLILSEYITEKEGKSLVNDCLAIKRILIPSLNTAKENN